MEAASCSFADIQRAINRCSYVLQHCHEEEIIKFTKLFYCDMEENYLALALLTVGPGRRSG